MSDAGHVGPSDVTGAVQGCVGGGGGGHRRRGGGPCRSLVASNNNLESLEQSGAHPAGQSRQCLLNSDRC